jgi:hypothetical protein
MDEGRKRVLAIVAGIIVAGQTICSVGRNAAPESTRWSRRQYSAAERIMKKFDAAVE